MATATEKEKNKHSEDNDKKSVTDKAKEMGNKAAEKTKDAAEYAKDKADQGVSATGKGMENVADNMRRKGPQEGVMGKANSAVAHTLENAGEYLDEKGLSGMAEDVTDVVRRNPIPAVLISVGVGYLLARLTSSSRS